MTGGVDSRWRTRTRRCVALVMVVAGLMAGCSSSAQPSPTSSAGSGPRFGPGSRDAAGTTWLCRPGEAADPCTADLATTIIDADGRRTTVHPRPMASPPIDCFYVYPTVSRQKTANANLHVDPEETAVAVDQASPFSQVCRVYAPMYPQLTLSAIGVAARQIDPHAAAVAYLGVLSAWQDYLTHDNHGRGVVLIGHSQGASMLTALVRNEIDPQPAERRLLVSALLMGGNVTVPIGQTVGGDFKDIPACQSEHQTGCVVAYSSFDSVPPANSLFGRVGTSIGSNLTQSTATLADLQVLCSNPSSLSGGTGSLSAYFRSDSIYAPGFGSNTGPRVPTPWVAFPGRYNATCMTSGGATWLQVSAVPDPGDHRPLVTQALGPRWGLHLVDVNLALGNLVGLVGDQSAAYSSSG